MSTKKNRACVATVLAAPAADYDDHLAKLRHLAGEAVRQGTVHRRQGEEGVVAAEVTLGNEKPYRPIRTRHWDGDPLENLHRLDKF